LPRQREGEGDLFALVQIVVPTVLSEREQALFKELADSSSFNPRVHFGAGSEK
jgi:curved DNA-binding protein